MITKESILSVEEFETILMSSEPHLKLEALRQNGRLQTLLPEMEPTYDMAQNAYHFGTVWEHTMKAVEVASETTEDMALRFATLLHDIGKPMSRTFDETNGKVHFTGHESTGSKLSRVILKRLGYPDDVIGEIAFYILHHMDARTWGQQCELAGIKYLRKLQYHCDSRERFDRLLIIIHADNMAHAKEWCKPEQTKYIAQLTDKMQAEGTDMFAFQPWLNDDEVKTIKGLENEAQIDAYQGYLLRLAYSNPFMDRETAIKNLKACKLKL